MSDEYPKKSSNARGTEEAYSVEARCTDIRPRTIAGRLFDNRWQKVAFDQAAIGVPGGPSHNHHSRHLGLLTYSAAQALRWWIHAAADVEVIGSICLETKLVKHQIRYEWSCEAVSEHAMVGGMETLRGEPTPPASELKP